MPTKLRTRTTLVVTVLNEARSLPGLLASIDAQVRPPDETIIVDGGSTDDTRAIASAWAASQSQAIVMSSPGANIAQGRNHGIRRAQGEIIAITDAGVVLDPDWLRLLVQTLDERPEVDVASGFFVAAPQSAFEWVLGALTIPEVHEINPASFLPSSRSVAFRHTAWSAVGGYPEWLDYGEDLVFDFTLRDAGYRFGWAPRARAAFRPRSSIQAFFLQYFRYARGDGKADLWRRRHAIRYGAYFIGLPLLWCHRRNPLVAGMGLAAGLLYLGRPIARWRSSRPDPRRRARTSLATTTLEGALLPLLRLTGDIAKMLGYPCGVAWRARRSIWP